MCLTPSYILFKHLKLFAFVFFFLCIYCQDLPGAMSPEELRELLNIPQVPKKPEKIVIGMELPAKGLKKGITKVKNFFTLTDF